MLNALRRQFESFILSPSYSKRFAVVKFFSLAVVQFLLASTNSRRQFRGFVLSPSKRKHSDTIHIFSFADVCDCRKVSLLRLFGLELLLLYFT